MNKPNLNVFIDSGFDMERPNSLGQTIIVELTENDECYGSERPRLNKPQVLDDYSFIESLEGFVWQIPILTSSQKEIISTKKFIECISKGMFIGWLSFKGVQKDSIFEEWAIANDVPVLEVK